MSDILDDLYSNFVLMCLIAFSLFIFFIFLSTKKPFGSKALNNIYKMFMYVCSIGFFISIPAFNYGHARSLEKIFVGKQTICVFEASIRAVGKSSGRPARIDILDKQSGIRKIRFTAGRPGHFLALHNDTLCYMDEKEVVLYDAVNLKEIYRIKKDEWGSILPELSVGIENVEMTDATIEYPAEHFIKLDCLNGKKYWFEPFSKKIYNKEPETIYISEFADRSSELVRKFSYHNEIKYMSTTATGEGTLEAIVPGSNAMHLFSKVDSTGYIAPFLICIDTTKNVFVFGHYTTTKKEQYHIEAKDFNYKTQWKKANNEIIDSSKDPKVNICSYVNNVLYIGIGGYLLALDPVTFKIYWQNHL